MPICRRLLEHSALAAASRTFWMAGKSKPIRMAMIAITTSNSISVKPEMDFRRAAYMERPPVGDEGTETHTINPRENTEILIEQKTKKPTENGDGYSCSRIPAGEVRWARRAEGKSEC